MADQKRIERAYGEGAQAAREGDVLDVVRHALGGLMAFGLDSEESKAWDKGFGDESGAE